MSDDENEPAVGQFKANEEGQLQLKIADESGFPVASIGTNRVNPNQKLHAEVLIGEATDAKHTTGTIDGYGFSLRVDGDAPAELVADIESALADVKAERETIEIEQHNTSCYVVDTNNKRHVMSLADVKDHDITKDGQVVLPDDHVCRECVNDTTERENDE
jgi:hypothetical protein